MYRALSALPTDARGALRALWEENALTDDNKASQEENDFGEIEHLLGAEVKPPRGGRACTAPTTMPGLTVVDHPVEDAVGRKAVALDMGRCRRGCGAVPLPAVRRRGAGPLSVGRRAGQGALFRLCAGRVPGCLSLRGLPGS